MKAFYNLTTAIKTTLEADPNVNTVTYGDIFKLPQNKKDMYPISHMIVNNATYGNAVWIMSVSILFMDALNYTKEQKVDKFVGNSNEHDILNTQMAVYARLVEILERGDLSIEGYQLTGTPSAEPFVDRFEEEVAGWTLNFDVMVDNTASIC